VGNSVNGYGIWGQSTTDATKLEGGLPYANVGVIGIADRGNGVLGYADIGAAVAGVATNSKGFAGFFNGNVQVTGFLSKGGSNFQIDHPLDPANKFLTHAAVESDQQKNFYDGLVKLNRKGEAEVRLPRWFTAINRDLCYQLTPIGAPGPARRRPAAQRKIPDLGRSRWPTHLLAGHRDSERPLGKSESAGRRDSQAAPAPRQVSSSGTLWEEKGIRDWLDRSSNTAHR
jgi:hypothetical protein